MKPVPAPETERARAQLLFIQGAARDLAAQAGLPLTQAVRLSEDLIAAIRQHLAEELTALVREAAKQRDSAATIAARFYIPVTTVRAILKTPEASQ